MNIRGIASMPVWIAALCAAAVAACVWAPAVLAVGTGDDPTPTEDVLTAREAAMKARLERDSPTDNTGPGSAEGGLSPLSLDAPYKYLWTPSHEQQRSYWCGPATCQVVDNYFGSCLSQGTYASLLRTSASGTDFSLVDDCLRYYTGLPYYYYGGLHESDFNARISHSLLDHSQPVAADVNIIASVWPYYQFDHPGHIVPIEAFDWRVWKVRLNDVFDESDYGGGSTFGHTTYDRAVVWNGVYNHFRRAVVAAP